MIGLESAPPIAVAGFWTYLYERPWTAALWVGLALLTTALLILMRTRWGQAKPISKCVVLSVLAHLWLVGYAADTVLLGPVRPAMEDEEYSVTMIEDEPQEELVEKESSKEIEPWKQLASDTAIQTQLTEPDRQQVGTPETQRESIDVAPSKDVFQHRSIVNDSGMTEQSFQDDIDDARPPVAKPIQVAQNRAPTPAPVQPIAMPKPTPIAAPVKPREAVAIQIDRNRPAAIETRTTKRETPQSLPDKAPGFSGLQQMAALNDNASEPTFRSAEEDDLTSAVKMPMGHTPVTTPTATADAGSADVMQQLPPLPRRLGDGKPLPASYRIRLAPERRKYVDRLGGNAQTEAAVNAALRWLAANQSADGRWDASSLEAGRGRAIDGHERNGAGADADTGITGLAILAFLASGNTHLEGQYRKKVQLGLEFLIERQAANGDLAGNARLFARMYCHGMAALALSEAYALSGDPRLKAATQRAMKYTIESQHPSTGGWRYQPGDLGDMSQFGWQAMAIRSAELAGITIPKSTRQRMQKFMSSVSVGQHKGLACYRPNEAKSVTMTAEALTCRLLLKMDNQPATVQEAVDYIMTSTPKEGEYNLYYWYYATLALHQIQDESWEKWNVAMQKRLLSMQIKDGGAVGSWDPESMWAGYGGRAYSTAMATLCLQVYYRYLPMQKTTPRVARKR